MVEQRRAELMQAGEGQLHLGFDADRRGEPASGRTSTHVLQQRGLADPRLAAEDQDATSTTSNVCQQPIQRPALAASTTQARPRIRARHRRWRA
jgi:hypothetical protein